MAIALSLVGYIIILPGTRVCGVRVGGLSVQKAADRIRENLNWDTRTITLTRGDESIEAFLGKDLGITPLYEASAAECRRPLWLGFRRDYPLLVSVDEAALSAFASKTAARFNREVRNASFAIEGDVVTVVPDVTGWTLDTGEFEEALRFEGGLNALPSSLSLPGEEMPPQVTAVELESYLPLERISTYRTEYADGNDRSHNIVLACESLSLVTLGPGETFSFNEVVGPRTKERGYRKAPVFVGADIMDDYGGGVCQVSTTLYLAMLKAGFRIAERYCHAQPVTYVPLGFDATVAYGYLDMRMTNPGESPCLLRATAKEGELTVEVFGRPVPDLAIEVESRVLKEIPAEQPEAGGGSGEVAGPGGDGSGGPEKPKLRSGFLVETVRKWVRDGQVERVERLNTSMYPPEKAK
ncbi:MAG: VanW family protein [Bacillota bacterium]